MAYPRKGRFMRGAVKFILNSNAIFSRLSDAQKNAVMDTAVQRVCSYRNSLNKEDYQIDTTLTEDFGGGGTDANLLVSIVAKPAALGEVITVEKNTPNVDFTFTITSPGKYVLEGDVDIFLDTYKIEAVNLVSTETDFFMPHVSKNTNRSINIDIIPLMGGETADHDFRLQISEVV